MLELVGPFEAHEFNNLEELSAMQILLCANDVDHLVEFVFFVSLDRASDVTGQIDGCAI